MSEIELYHEITQFLYQESDYLDERDYDSWLTMLHPDVRYFIPLVRNVPRKSTEEYTREQQDNAWMDEGFLTIEKRIKQFKTNIHWAEEPPSRVAHLVTNTRILSTEGEVGSRVLETKSRVLVYQNRIDDEENLFVAKRMDRLIEVPESQHGWQLLHRTVHLNQSVLLAKALTVFI